MSMSASAWAKRQNTGTSGAKLVLMIVADYATSTEHGPVAAEGRHYAWPGIPRIAADCLMSERTVITHLAALEALDLVRREERRDRDGRRTTDYLILPVDDAGDNPWITDQTGAYVDQVQNLHVKDSPTSGATFADPSSTRTTKEPPSPSTRAGKRKLPEDFTVTEEMRAWYVKTIGGAVDGAAEHAKFLDYWRGTGKLMADWPATWRNWMRRAAERGGGARPTSGAPAGAFFRPRYPTAQERQQQHREEFTALAKEAEAWVEANGGDPEDGQLVLQVMERIKAERAKGSATRKPDMYSDGKDVINGYVVGPKEVTAGEGS